MIIDQIKKVAQLRICVAYLGEKEQNNWWPSSFLSPSGKAFLTPVFPKTSLLAQVCGASEAAKLVHDEFIGIGEVYHLFRLQENLEHELTEQFSQHQQDIQVPNNVENALEILKDLAENGSTTGVGPLLIGEGAEEDWLKEVAAAYLKGFEQAQVVYPYFRSVA
ncbi:BrxE family protein [Vibrio sp.]|uniref:BrxE family protein n=1 Tax=Vibrio sp. TaxID=678 RepID=UPI003F6D3B13